MRVGLIVLFAFISSQVVVAQVPACNVTQDQNTSVNDVQQMLNEALGVAVPTNDLNADGVVNVVDTQIVINAARAMGCSAFSILSSISPASGAAGLSPTVAIIGLNGFFAQNSTQANFGAGISVGGAPEGQAGPVTIVTPTMATAHLAIDPTATPGTRNVTLTTGAQVATLTNGFSVLPALPAYGQLTVVSTSPGAGAAGVGLSPTIQIVFNEPLDASTVTPSTFTLGNGATTLPSSLSYNAASSTVTLTFSGLLMPQTVYTVTVAAQVRSISEGQLGSQLTFSFTTEAATAVAGVITAPIGLSPTTLSVVSHGGIVTSPDSNGNFQATVSPLGPTLVAAMIPGETFGFMAITFGGMPAETAASERNAESLAPRARPVHRTQWQVTASAAASSTSGLVADFQTTAESLVFLAPSLFSSDPTRATNTMAQIATNSATELLAQALSQNWKQANPLSVPAVEAAGKAAVAAVVQSIIQQAASSIPTIFAGSGTVPGNVAVTSYCLSGMLDLPWSGLPCLDLHYISFPSGSYAQNPDGSFSFTPHDCSFPSIGCAVGWYVHVAPFSNGQLPASIQPAGSKSSPESPTGGFDDYACNSSSPCAFFWLDGNSYFSYLDWQNDVQKAASAVLSTLGTSSSSTFSLPEPIGQTNYVARFYSGGIADRTELQEVLLGDFSDQQSLELWGLAELMNITSSVLNELSATKLFPTAVVDCVAKAMINEIPNAVGTLTADPGLSTLENQVAETAANFEAQLAPCGAQGLVSAASAAAGAASWFSGVGTAADLLGAAANVGEVLQRDVELLLLANPIETALISIAPVSSLPGNPVPSISSLSPGSAPAGSSPPILTIIGNGFLQSSTVSVLGTSRNVTYVSSGELQIALSAQDLATPGNVNVTVTNGAPGVEQASATFLVQPIIISGLSPLSGTAGGPAFTLTVNGSGFVFGSKVYWNTTSLTLTSGSGVQITATVPASLIATVGSGSVTVVNPGGSVSNAVIFTIQAAPPTPGNISTYAGTDGVPGYSGDGGQATSAAFANPDGLAADGAGNLYISDSLHCVIRKVTHAGVISTYAGNGGCDWAGDGGPATSAKLFSPAGLAVDATGNLYIADFWNNVVRKVAASGVISTVAGYVASFGTGTGNRGYWGDGGPATSAGLNNPAGVAVDTVGNLYIADYGNNLIRKVTPGGVISTVAGIWFSGYSGDGGPATSASLYLPFGVAVDALGELYIADTGNNVIRKVDTKGVISTIAGTGGQAYSGDGGPATSAALDVPSDVVLDAAGNLYIADAYNSVVRKVASNGVISTYAGNGQFDYYGDGGPATRAALNQPESVALDASGNLYIGDYYNYVVRKVNHY